MARRQQVQIERRRSARHTLPASSIVVPTRPIADTRPAAEVLERIERVLGLR